MDRRLLEALNNIGLSLDELVDALREGNEDNEPTVATVLKSFDTQLESISESLLEIKGDTSKILSNQDTIIKLSKDRENSTKTGDEFENAGGKNMDAIKKGVGSIILIAGAVLIMGTAFKIIGNVDFLSVVSLSLALMLISETFIKISQLDGLDYNKILMTSVALVAIASAMVLSSYILSMMSPIGLTQFVSAIMVAAIFVPLSYAIKGITSGLKGVDPVTMGIVAISLPFLMPALALAMMKSSEYLGNIQPIGLMQFVSAILIGAIFVVLSFGLKQIISAFSGIDPATAFTISLTIPLLLVAISASITASSYILNAMEPVPANILLNALLLGAVLGVVSLIMSPVINRLKDIKVTDVLKGGLILIAIAGIIAVSSHVLNFGEYGNYPGLGWVLGVTASLVAFGVSAMILGTFMAGPQAIIFGLGLVAVLGLATTIMGVSKILNEGDYNIPGMLNWATAVSLLYITFVPILAVLGVAALASSVMSVFGVNPWKKAQSAVEDVARTIVSVSHILKEGDYSGGPNATWAGGIAIALGAFAPVYSMLLKNSVMEALGSGGVGPDEFASAIETVAKGIVTASLYLSMNKGTFVDGPGEEWAKGVGLSIGAFAPVYSMLLASKILDDSSLSPEGFVNAIQTVSMGIVESARIFAESDVEFGVANYPKAEWGEGVGLAINAFSPVYELLLNQKWWKGNQIGLMTIGVNSLIDSIKYAGLEFSKVNWSNHPNSRWGEGIKDLVAIWTNINEEVKGINFKYIKNAVSNISYVGNSLGKASSEFNKIPNSAKMLDITLGIKHFTNLINSLVESESGGGGILNRLGSVLSGDKDPIVLISNRMITLAKGYDAMANSLIKLSGAMQMLNISSTEQLGGVTSALSGINLKTDNNRIMTNQIASPMVNRGEGSNVSTNNQNSQLIEKVDILIGLLTNVDNSSVNISKILKDKFDETEDNKESNLYGWTK